MQYSSTYYIYIYIIIFNTHVGLTIEIRVDDNATSRTHFCVGERLTLICNGKTEAYIWRIPPLLTFNELTVSAGLPIVTVNNFTATFISITETRLQFNVSSELNDTTITCMDLLRNQDFSTMTLLLLGMMFYGGRVFY